MIARTRWHISLGHLSSYFKHGTSTLHTCDHTPHGSALKAHTTHLTTHNSHLTPTPLTLPLRFTPTILTPGASHRTPQIQKLTPKTSYLPPHSSQLKLTTHSSHLAFPPSDNATDTSCFTPQTSMLTPNYPCFKQKLCETIVQC